jgi:hypothetical protein
MYKPGVQPLTNNLPSWCSSYRQGTKLLLQATDNFYQAGAAAVTDNVPSTFQGSKKKLPEAMFGTNLKIQAA